MLRAAVGTVAVTGAVLASAVTAVADSSPTPAPAPSVADAESPGQGPVTPVTSPAPTPSVTDAGSPGQGPVTPVTSPTPTPSVTDGGSDGQGPVTPVRCVATKTQNIGAGTAAVLSIGPSGPSVRFQGAGEDGYLPGLFLDRAHPKLPASAGFLAEILQPSSSHPQLRTNMEGGGHPASVTAFPGLPEGCSFTYPTDESGQSGTSGQGGAVQTSVVPKGGVAAGYEASDGGDSPLVAIGGAAAAAGAAGLAFVALRRRRSAATR
ncbi:hypothetical protein B9W62_24820 [Streptomyces sp. CS113]|uniref:hypothetical protein n=1 Tax=Streptomyces sp. CS113 TaxID=1982761 RepID=UPI000B40E35C|nr:hypothetical protein [Streptomyces sp. CS113]OWA03542.1 hypothetical protein B9W62_24820 [Streptomyces sp. CS113]